MGGDHLSNKCYILALSGLLLFVSIASAAQVNEAMGPFKISFELPSKEVTNEIAGSTLRGLFYLVRYDHFSRQSSC